MKYIVFMVICYKHKTSLFIIIYYILLVVALNFNLQQCYMCRPLPSPRCLIFTQQWRMVYIVDVPGNFGRSDHQLFYAKNKRSQLLKKCFVKLTKFIKTFQNAKLIYYRLQRCCDKTVCFTSIFSTQKFSRVKLLKIKIKFRVFSKLLSVLKRKILDFCCFIFIEGYKKPQVHF